MADYKKLAYSAIIDLIGVATYALPGWAEFADLIWAPISGFLIYRLYGYKIWAVAGALEELLPGTDVIPTATLLWFYTTFKKK